MILQAKLLSANAISSPLVCFIYHQALNSEILLSARGVYLCIVLTLREEHRLRVFENRVLRGIFGSKRDGVRGEWRKLHNEELNDLYCSPNIVRVIKNREE